MSSLAVARHSLVSQSDGHAPRDVMAVPNPPPHPARYFSGKVPRIFCRILLWMSVQNTAAVIVSCRQPNKESVTQIYCTEIGQERTRPVSRASDINPEDEQTQTHFLCFAVLGLQKQGFQIPPLFPADVLLRNFSSFPQLLTMLVTYSTVLK